MKILVTGASGFLGTAVVERLLSSGHYNLRCLVRPSSRLSALDNVCAQYLEARVEYLFGNLASPDIARAAVKGVDTVYHLAAGTHGLPATLFFDAVVASQRLLEALRGEQARVVLVSSIGVYNTSKLSANCLVNEECEVETHPEKRNAYFHAKLWQEQLFREAASNAGLDIVILRPGVLYGRNTNILPARVGLRLGRVLLQLGADNVLPLSHVVNCAEALVLAGESNTDSGQSYNVVDDDLPTVSQYVRLYNARVEKLRAIYFPFTVTRVMSRVVHRYHVYSRGQIPRVLSEYESMAMWKSHRFDNRKLKSIGWKQVVPTNLAIEETLTGYRERSHPIDPPFHDSPARPLSDYARPISR